MKLWAKICIWAFILTGIPVVVVLSLLLWKLGSDRESIQAEARDRLPKMTNVYWASIVVILLLYTITISSQIIMALD